MPYYITTLYFQLGSESNFGLNDINDFMLRHRTMNEESKYHLANTKFENNAATIFRNIYAEESFTDVTIACEDGKIVKAHKIVLSASSAVFNKILMQYSDTNPVIYFGDTSYKHIEYILQYAYVGEVSVEESELQQFMATANKFRINGLYSDQTQKVHSENLNDLDKEEESLKSIKDEEIKKKFIGDEYRMEVVDTYLDVSKAADFTCDQCEYKTTTKEYLRIHRRSIHDGVKYPCNKCDYKATQSSSLMQHKLSIHEGVKYPCPQCDYKAARPSRLNSHVREIHEGIEYPCLQCNCKAPTRKRLNLHVKSVHEGISYSCNQCDFTNVSKQQLKRHQEMVHYGLRFLCDVDKCEYSAGNRSRLSKHKTDLHCEKIKTEKGN